jgi:hypothetical protein
MAFLKRWFSRGGKSGDAPQAGDENVPGTFIRRRNFQSLSPTEGDAAVPEPKESRASQPPKAERKPRAPKKPDTATKAVKESVSVVLRRQVPVRFDEEARSWLGGLPRMPAGTEWPRAKPKKHYISWHSSIAPASRRNCEAASARARAGCCCSSTSKRSSSKAGVRLRGCFTCPT